MGKVSIANFKKAYYYLKRNGVQKAWYAVWERIKEKESYQYEAPSQEELEKQRGTEFPQTPYFSILVPVYHTDPDFFREMIQSVLNQTYGHFELILADAGKSEELKEISETFQDDRIVYLPLEKNEGISANTNAALQVAKGEYIGLLDHDDLLTEDALFTVAEQIEKTSGEKNPKRFFYTDEDKCDETGEHFYDYHKKMDFNLDLLFTNNYICHFLVMDSALMNELQFRSDFDGAQDYDLVLRAVGKLWEENPQVEDLICHIPKVTYHWRCHRNSTAQNPASKKYAYEAGRRALEDFVKEKGWKASVKHTDHVGFYRIEYEKDIWDSREDVAMVNGPIYYKNKVVGGAYGKNQELTYGMVPKGFGGYLHRAKLQQNCKQIDLFQARISPKVWENWDKLMPADLQKDKLQWIWDTEKGNPVFAHNKEQYQNCKVAVCNKLLELGYRLYYDPEWEHTV